MPSLTEKSPLGVFQAHLAKGELAYQVCLDDNKPFFYPRAVAPVTGSTNIEWRVSKGLGTVYTTTAIHYKGEPPLNVAMIDLDEGFRMMSRVEKPKLPSTAHLKSSPWSRFTGRGWVLPRLLEGWFWLMPLEGLMSPGERGALVSCGPLCPLAFALRRSVLPAMTSRWRSNRERRR